MAQSPVMETIADLKPRTVTHENTKLYSMLKQCMETNHELRMALMEATETIEKLTQLLEHKNES